MGKNKDETPNPMSIANRDILQRLNFLYQASVLLNGLAPPRPISSPPALTTHGDKDKDSTGPESQRKKRRRRVVTFEELSRSYVDTMKRVGCKTNVRMDPSVKRRLCKRCSAPLLPGISATVRVSESTSHGHQVSYRCHTCQTERRIPAPPALRVNPLTEDGMEVTGEASTAASGHALHPEQPKRKTRGPQPRLPPHFARDIGHVVFRGNERLDATHTHHVS